MATEIVYTQEAQPATDTISTNTENKQETELTARYSGDFVEVRSWLFVLNISNIDSVNQTFRAKCHLHYWRLLTSQEKRIYNQLEDKNLFNPMMSMTVLPHITHEVIANEPLQFNNGKQHVVGYDDVFGAITVGYIHVLDCVFLECFELKNFPFDLQHFEIKIEYKVEVVHDKYGYTPVRVNMDKSGIIMSFGSKTAAEWDFKGLEITSDNPNLEQYAEVLNTSAKNVLSLNEYVLQEHNSFIKFRIQYHRAWSFYIYRVVAVLGIVSFLTMGSFTFGANDSLSIIDSTADRFSYVSTMLLTAVAYMFITTQFIPALGYLTWLDKYVYFTFLFILLTGIQCAILSIDTDVINTRNLNLSFVIFDACLWFLSHVVLLVIGVKAYNVEKEKMNMSKEMIDEQEEAHHKKMYGEQVDYCGISHMVRSIDEAKKDPHFREYVKKDGGKVYKMINL
eukprot:50406_1